MEVIVGEIHLTYMAKKRLMDNLILSCAVKINLQIEESKSEIWLARFFVVHIYIGYRN